MHHCIMIKRIPPSAQGIKHTMVVKRCVSCESPFEVPAKFARRYSTCSRACSSRRRSDLGWGYAWTKCEVCEKELQVRVAKLERGLFKYCSDECRIVGLNKFQERETRRGSEKRYFEEKGYVRVIDWSTGKRRFIMEHRLVMERMIGRQLRPEERVHHINGDRADNRPENLRLYASHAEHMRVEHPERSHQMHAAKRRKNALRRRARESGN